MISELDSVLLPWSSISSQPQNNSQLPISTSILLISYLNLEVIRFSFIFISFMFRNQLGLCLGLLQGLPQAWQWARYDFVEETAWKGRRSPYQHCPSGCTESSESQHQVLSSYFRGLWSNFTSKHPEPPVLEPCSSLLYYQLQKDEPVHLRFHWIPRGSSQTAVLLIQVP